MKHGWMIWYAVLLHWMWGVMVFTAPGFAETSILMALSKFIHAPALLATILIVSCLLSIAGLSLVKKWGWKAFFLFVPQLLLLLVSTLGAFVMIKQGIGSGYVVSAVSQCFWIAAVAPIIFATVLYILNMVQLLRKK